MKASPKPHTVHIWLFFRVTSQSVAEVPLRTPRYFQGIHKENDSFLNNKSVGKSDFLHHILNKNDTTKH